MFKLVDRNKYLKLARLQWEDLLSSLDIQFQTISVLVLCS